MDSFIFPVTVLPDGCGNALCFRQNAQNGKQGLSSRPLASHLWCRRFNCSICNSPCQNQSRSCIFYRNDRGNSAGIWNRPCYGTPFSDAVLGYSKEFLNVNGYICLPASLAWGIFSTALIYVFHPPLERFVLLLPLPASDGISLGLSVLFTVDVTRSVQTALDLRAVMENLTSSNQRIAGISGAFETAY